MKIIRDSTFMLLAKVISQIKSLMHLKLEVTGNKLEKILLLKWLISIGVLLTVNKKVIIKQINVFEKNLFLFSIILNSLMAFAQKLILLDHSEITMRAMILQKKKVILYLIQHQQLFWSLIYLISVRLISLKTDFENYKMVAVNMKEFLKSIAKKTCGQLSLQI